MFTELLWKIVSVCGKVFNVISPLAVGDCLGTIGLLVSVSLKFLVRAVSSTCLNGFWYYLTQLFSIIRWCVMLMGSHLLPRSGSQFVRLSFCPKFPVRVVSSTCLNGFWYYLIQLFSKTRWCVMHITQPPTPKVNVTVWAQTLSSRNFVSGLYLPHVEWILILLHTFILQNKMMCHAHHPATYSQGQCNSLCSNLVRPQFRVRAVSSTCLNGFWYYFTQLFSIIKWCVMQITQPPTSKVKVTVCAQTLSVRNFCMLKWFLILPNTIILHKMMCHAQQQDTFSQGQGHNLGSNVLRLFWCVRAVSSTCLNGFWYNFTQLLFIARWCVMHNNQTLIPKVKVRLEDFVPQFHVYNSRTSHI